jgi:phage terminase large subunit
MDKIRLLEKYKPLFLETPESRYYFITGGRGSGKSWTLALFLLNLTYESGHVILFTRWTLTSAFISIIPEFIDKIGIMGKDDDFEITQSEIINRLTGSKIIFRGIKTSQGTATANLKSIAGVTTWVLDEAEELTDEDVFDRIDLSIRSKERDNRVILVMNPSFKSHWIYKRWIEKSKQECTYIHTTYLDNINNLSESYINQIEQIRQRRPEKFKHQILGGWLDRAEGVIYNNWTIGEFKTPSVSVFGQDFGFSVDPTTLIETNIDKGNKLIYVRLHYYKPNLTTSDISHLNASFAGKGLIVADSAEPRLISELKAKGNNIVGTIKGKDSITYGISLLLDYDLVIDPNSIELIKELNNYCWLEKKSSTPIDDYNHALDALRYAVSYQLENPNKGKYYVY